MKSKSQIFHNLIYKFILVMVITNLFPFTFPTETNIIKASDSKVVQLFPAHTQQFGSIKSPEATTLNIYTYESLINWGENYTLANEIVFDKFAENHNITIDLRYFGDANEILTVVLEEKDNPTADLIIGIDNILVYEAKKYNLLEKYNSPVLENVSSELIDLLDSEKYLLPYDWSSIALWYDASYFQDEYGLDQNFFDQITLEDMLDDKIAKEWVTENPLHSSPGLAFFLWTVAVCDYAPNGPDMRWEDWWEEIDEKIQVEDSWSDAYTVFDTGTKHIFTSYAADGAFSWYMYNDTSLTASITHENGGTGDNGYGWLQIEGIGIVSGTPHQTIAREFVDWFLSPTVQEIIPENNWMFPANNKVDLPASFDYAINISKLEPLNGLVPQSDIENYLGDWLDKWERIMIEEEGAFIAGFQVIIIPFAIIALLVGKKKLKFYL